MYCANCGKQILNNVNFCPYCGAKTTISSNTSSTDNTRSNSQINQTNRTQNQTRKIPSNRNNNIQRRRTIDRISDIISNIIIVIGVLLISLILISVIITIKNHLTQPSTHNSSNTVYSNNASTENKTEAEPINDSKQSTNMTIGSFEKDGDYYIGLMAVKSLDYIQTAFNNYKEDISPDHEIIYLFFDVYNNSDYLRKFPKNSITLYADSSKASTPNTNLRIGINGYEDYSSYEVDGGAKCLIIRAFEVEKGWKALTVFSNDLSWSVSPNDLLSEEFTYESLYDINLNFSLTEKGSIVYSKDYELHYDDFLIYTHTVLDQEREYAVFKFTINNYSDNTIDYNNVGYEMRAYHNLRLLDSADYTLNDNIDGYQNIYDVKEIKPNMSAKFYIPFETNDTHGSFICSYDTGYIVNKLLGYIYAEN